MAAVTAAVTVAVTVVVVVTSKPRRFPSRGKHGMRQPGGKGGFFHIDYRRKHGS